MKVDITRALEEHFIYNVYAAPGFKHNKEKTVGLMKTDDFFDDNIYLPFDVSSKDIEITDPIIQMYPEFKKISSVFYLHTPNRIIADGVMSAAFIYSEYTFIVAPIRQL